MRTAILFSVIVFSTACVPTTEQYANSMNSVSNVVESSLITGRKAIEDALTKPKKRDLNNETAENLGNASISDEQDFEAVSSRETIESDAERRKRQSAKYNAHAQYGVALLDACNLFSPKRFLHRGVLNFIEGCHGESKIAGHTRGSPRSGIPRLPVARGGSRGSPMLVESGIAGRLR